VPILTLLNKFSAFYMLYINGEVMIKDKFFDSLVNTCKVQANKNNLYGWEARIIKKRSYQELLYPEKSGAGSNILAPETIRFPVSEITYSLTVYVRYGNPEVMGNANVTIQPGYDLEKQIDVAIASASAVGNPAWNLTKPVPGARIPRIRLVDPKIKNNPEIAARIIRNCANDCFSSLKDSILVNYAELFLDSFEIRTVTGSGFDLARESSSIYFEAAAEKLPLPNTQEVHRNTGALSLDGFDTSSFCAKLSDEVLSLGDTVMPDTDNNVALLVDDDTASAVLHCLLAQLDATMEYAKKPFLKEGVPVYKGNLAPDSETLNITLDPFIDFAAESVPYTSEGLVPVRDCVIDKSIVRRRAVSNRMSQYLGVRVSPVMGNIVVPPGTKSYEELTRCADRVIEIKSFSSLLLNSDYLTYSSEIKLAKEYDNKKGTTRQLKGGVVSGSIMENFSSFLSSREIAIFNKVDDGYSGSEGYIGPKYMLFKKGVAISGNGK
jgi:predicted Zn-dependent protease